MKKRWLGRPPAKCDICQDLIVDTFIDGATVHGPWANMCERCSTIHGHGIGPGRGQKYQRNSTENIWEKMAG